MKSVYLLKDILAQLSVAACDGVLTMIKLRERLLFEYFTKVTHDVKTRLEAAREIKLGAISILWYRFHALNKSIFRCLLRTHDRCIQNDFFKKKKKRKKWIKLDEITFVCWIRDQIGTVEEFGLDFTCCSQKPNTIEIFLERDKRTSISHLKSHVSKGWRLLVLYNFSDERIHQQLTLSSTNVLSFFSFENSTHSRFSHSLPSSADSMKGKIQTWISKLFFIDFRFVIFTRLCSYLLNMVSHPSNFSDNIATNPSM